MDSLCFDVESAEGCGDPGVSPRVGDEYQAEIPSLIAAPYISQLVKKTRDSEITVNVPESNSLGLPIPLVWQYCKSESGCGCGTLESVTSQEGQVISKNEGPKVNLVLQTASNVEAENGGRFSNSESSSRAYDEKDQSRGKYLLPGLLNDQSWTDIECNSFLLGLYIFGKNLTFIERFVGSKNMGDILSFYYGKFFKSKEYSRWSECRKLKAKRCIYGQKIFTGWRQQELLSRLFSNVPRECQTKVVEISRNFGEGRMPFEEYVFALKNAVGIDLLVAAVAIGKGKQDLTGTAVEPTKTNHMFSLRPEIPVGKACSSLTSADIIKFLTGGFRLSKARSSDLFWEAVWPRLLAKGWHSEQPMDQIVSGSKQSLVFLVPGVRKFSRRKLVKGNDYFDSISDVLNKVASDPGLLETEIQATVGSEDMKNTRDKRDLEGMSNRQQICGLEKDSSKCNRDLVKFTIVDTSMVHDMNQNKVRQMRSLPFQTMSISTISSCSNESEQGTSEDSEGQVEQANASRPIEDHVGQANASTTVEGQVGQSNSSRPIEDQVDQAYSSNPIEDFSYRGLSIDSSDSTCDPEALHTTKEETNFHKCHSDLHNYEHSKDINEHHLIQKVTSDSTIPCIMAMQKLRACSHAEFSHFTESVSVGRKFDLNEPILPSNLHEASEDMVLSMDLESSSFPSYLAKGSPNLTIEGCAPESHLAGDVSAENSETRMLIDLNLPQLPSELGIDLEIPSSESSMSIIHNDNQCENTFPPPSEITQLNVTQEYSDGTKEQQSLNANRRQSTRNRPLTTKALEALEYGFLNSKRKRKNTESSDNNSKSKCFPVSSDRIISAASDNDIGNSMTDTRAEEENVIRAYNYSINLNGSPL